MKVKSEAVIIGQTIHKLHELGIPADGSSHLIKDLRALMVRINDIKAGGNRGFDGEYFWGYIDFTFSTLVYYIKCFMVNICL